MLSMPPGVPGRKPPRASPSLRIDWIDIFSYANELPVCMYAGAEKGADGVACWLDFSHGELGDGRARAQAGRTTAERQVVEYCLRDPAHADPGANWRPIRSAGSCRLVVAVLRARWKKRSAVGLPIPRTLVQQSGDARQHRFCSMYLMVHDLYGSGRCTRRPHALHVPESGASLPLHDLTVV